MKRVLGFILIAIMCISCPFSTNSASLSEYDGRTTQESGEVLLPEEDSFLLSFGDLTTPIEFFRGENVNLYTVYTHPEDVLSRILNRYVNELSWIMDYYGAESPTINNFVEYKNYCSEYYQETNITRVAELVRLYDILENSEKNIEIISIMSESEDTQDEDINRTLATLLPYGNKFMLDSESNRQGSDRSWNFNDAYSYATTYYSNYNTNYRNFNLSLTPGAGDRTNFASQIRYAGGRPMYASWYYYGYFNFSSTWSFADDYMKFLAPKTKQNLSNPTNSFIDFSHLIDPGDFVTFDYENDGDYDHAGFITEADNYRAYWLVKGSDGTNYGTVYYWDFKVAQHSTDYNEWASDANCVNGWDVLPFNYPNVMFYVCQA